jgi:phosphoenolpyruvate carboxylase
MYNYFRTNIFWSFNQQATPIDVIEESKIGSRPARRTGKRTFADLRAIPWVLVGDSRVTTLQAGTVLVQLWKKCSLNNLKKYKKLKELIRSSQFVRYVFN